MLRKWDRKHLIKCIYPGPVEKNLYIKGGGQKYSPFVFYSGLDLMTQEISAGPLKFCNYIRGSKVVKPILTLSAETMSVLSNENFGVDENLCRRKFRAIYETFLEGN